MISRGCTDRARGTMLASLAFVQTEFAWRSIGTVPVRRLATFHREVLGSNMRSVAYHAFQSGS